MRFEIEVPGEVADWITSRITEGLRFDQVAAALLAEAFSREAAGREAGARQEAALARRIHQLISSGAPILRADSAGYVHSQLHSRLDQLKDGNDHQ